MTKISELTSIVTAAATDIIAVVQDGVTKQVTVQDYIDEGVLAAPGGGSPGLSDYSDVVVVDAGGNGDYATLREAAAAAPDNSLIMVMGNTVETDDIVFSQNVHVFGFGKNILQSQPRVVLPVNKIVQLASGGKTVSMSNISIYQTQTSSIPFSLGSTASLQLYNCAINADIAISSYGNLSAHRSQLRNITVNGSSGPGIGAQCHLFDGSQALALTFIDGYLIEIVRSKLNVSSGAALTIPHNKIYKILYSEIISSAVGILVTGGAPTLTWPNAGMIHSHIQGGINAIESPSTWSNAPIYQCTLRGALVNATPAPGTPAGTNVII